VDFEKGVSLQLIPRGKIEMSRGHALKRWLTTTDRTSAFCIWPRPFMAVFGGALPGCAGQLSAADLRF
jgi:hypothetical protein